MTCFSLHSALQELHRQGHEIGAFSITTSEEEDYWLDGSYDDWLAEMAGARLIIERFAGISDGSVIGKCASGKGQREREGSLVNSM